MPPPGPPAWDRPGNGAIQPVNKQTNKLYLSIITGGVGSSTVFCDVCKADIPILKSILKVDLK